MNKKRLLGLVLSIFPRENEVAGKGLPDNDAVSCIIIQIKFKDRKSTR